MRTPVFVLLEIIAGAALFLILRAVNNDYLFFAGYTVLQFIVLSTAWNILGGYCGYVNFGSAGFFALGVYTSVFLYTVNQNLEDLMPEWLLPLMQAIFPLPMPALILLGGIVAGLVGLGTGYLTLRLRGVFFAIATLALAVVLQTFVVNWSFVGGSRGAYVIPPGTVPILGPYIQYLFLLMLLLVILSLTCARLIERSRLGYGFATIRDVEPGSAFDLSYAVNSIAMPMIGGTTWWAGPMLGAVLLGTLQQIATVTISSAVNLLIVGLLLIGFVIAAPDGIIGLWHTWTSRRSKP